MISAQNLQLLLSGSKVKLFFTLLILLSSNILMAQDDDDDDEVVTELSKEHPFKHLQNLEKDKKETYHIAFILPIRKKDGSVNKDALSFWEGVQVALPRIKKLNAKFKIHIWDNYNSDSITKSIIQNDLMNLPIDVVVAPFYTKELLSELMNKADFIKFNDDELYEISAFLGSPFHSLEQNMQFIAEKTNTQHICVTKGSHGAVLMYNDQMFYNSGYKITVADTVGAGDSFLAGLLTQLLTGVDPQKAINFAMTSFLTTGGIRGGSEKISKFQPRSFIMGISKKAFETSNGFGNIHPGEDPDLSIRLWKLGYNTRLFPKAFVYHKRRIDWDKFSIQVNKFGKARPILDSWYPEYSKLTFFFPTLFILGFVLSVFLFLFGISFPIICYAFYYLLVLVSASIQSKSLEIGFLSVIAVTKQFFGYGKGFLDSYIKIKIQKQKPEEAFPELFFKVKS
jgi:hypothetical protein